MSISKMTNLIISIADFWTSSFLNSLIASSVLCIFYVNHSTLLYSIPAVESLTVFPPQWVVLTLSLTREEINHSTLLYGIPAVESLTVFPQQWVVLTLSLTRGEINLPSTQTLAHIIVKQMEAQNLRLHLKSLNLLLMWNVYLI